MARTYEPIATQTLGSATSTVTFSSILATYTDLILVVNFGFSGGNQTITIQFNGDAGSNYSFTELYGSGTAAGSGRSSNQASIYSGLQVAPSTSLDNNFIMHIQNYSNTTTYKTTISRENAVTSGTYPGTNTMVGLWRSTSAISSLTMVPSNGVNFLAGSSLTLYGIKSA